MRSDPAKIRRSLLRRVEQWLRTRSSPRLHMLLIVTATGAFGFLASFLMLKAGVDAMGIRYPLAVGLSYLMFLLLLMIRGIHDERE